MNAAVPAPDSCDYCGLPLPRPWWGGSIRNATAVGPPPVAGAISDADPQYCCVGCRFAAQVTRERGEEGAVRWTLAKLGLSVFFTMNVLVFSMALWSEDFYALEIDRTTSVVAAVFRYLCLLFAFPVLLLLGQPLLKNAWDGLRRGVYSTDLLLFSGVIAAYVYSAVSIFRGAGAIYFEVGCVVLVLVTLGRWMEATGRLRSTAALDALEKLLPATVRLVRDGLESSLPAGEIRVGDRFRVLAGERIPTDGRVLAGVAAVDQQVLTGESWPVIRQLGDDLWGGTLNLDGNLEMEATATPDDGTFRRMIEAVRRARAAKGRYERLADRISTWFLPAISVVALAAFSFHSWNSGWEAGILRGLAVVLIACPCALGIATPMAVWSALGRAAQVQVLFQSGESLERLAQVRAICFDKTGTLTTGAPAVVEFVTTGEDPPENVLRYAVLAALASTHPLSKAIVDFARRGRVETNELRSRNCVSPSTDTIAESRSYPGQGVVVAADHNRPAIYLGNHKFLAAMGLHTSGQDESHYSNALKNGRPVVLIGWSKRVKGIFTFEEQLRPEARASIRRCREIGLHTVVLTGDHERRAREIARELEITVESGLLPEDKVERVQAARAMHGPVAMVGDGINDAPALAAGDVGIALGCGADITRDSAAVCLLGNDLLRLPWAVLLAQRAVRVIRINLFWAFGYNFVGVALAAGGWLNPALAALFMVVSSLLVVANSLKLGHFELLDPELPAGIASVVGVPPAHPWVQGNGPAENVSGSSEDSEFLVRTLGEQGFTAPIVDPCGVSSATEAAT